MRKRFISAFIVLCMIICTIPAEVSALVGAVREPSELVTGRSEVYNGYKVSWINNKYIRFYFLEDSRDRDKNNYMVTVPARSEGSAAEAYDMVFNKKIYQREYFTKNSSEVPYDSRNVSINLSERCITVGYTFGGKYNAHTKYVIEKLDEGETNGFTPGGTLSADDSDSGKTYGIRAYSTAGYMLDQTKIEYPNLRHCVEMKGFNRMGHDSAQDAASLYMNTAIGNTSDGFTNTPAAIPGAMSRIKTNKVMYSAKSEAITEVMTKGYTWANPFTATSLLYSRYVDGFDYEDAMPDYVSTTANGDVIIENEVGLMGIEMWHSSYSTLWGFRGLYTNDDSSFTPSDDVKISTEAKHLGLYKNGDGYIAVPAKNENELGAHKKKYGEPKAVIRGAFEEKDGRYEFTAGVAALSSTITAVWLISDGRLSVGKDGSIELSHLSLNTPTFKFYQEKSGASDGLSMGMCDDGISVTMNPDTNSAVMAIDIPGTDIKPDGAVIKNSGNISFVGEVSFQLFPGAEFNIEELGYGIKQEKFKVNGIRANGKIDTAEMIGLEMGKLEGVIDTFKPYYHFTMELNVFDLFESEAELELKKSKLTGSLMPNKLYFYAGSDLAKIPLVPPVVVAYIKGAGGGFDGLADSFNGDFFAIPPLKLKITGKGEVLNVLEAKASYTLGPAYFKFEAEDVGISFMKQLKLIDEFSIYEGVQGETRSYGGKDYTGLSAMGGAGVHISIPQNLKIIQAEGNLDASVFAGLDSYKSPTSAYAVADLSGGVRGSLHLPDEGFGAISGLCLGSTGFDFYLGANTRMNVRGSFDDAINSLFNNFKVYGGVKKEANWKIFKYRIYYIFPQNNIGYTIRGPLRSLPEWDWSEHRPTSGYAEYTDEDGAVVYAAVNAEDIGIIVEENASEYAVSGGNTFSKDVIINVSPEEQIPDEGNLIIMVTPKDDSTDINAFADSLSVTKDGSPIDLIKPVYNQNGEIENESDMNVYIMKNGIGKNCVLIGVGDTNVNNGDSWNVASSLADFDASVNASKPFDSLSASLSGYSLNGSVKNPDGDTEYILATYFGSEPGKTENIIEYKDVTDTSDISAVIPREGTMLPSGDYYVTARLLKKILADINGTSEEILLPVDSAEFGSVTYTNMLQPNAPSGAAIKPSGNEVMNAEWNEVGNAGGYSVAIYQQQDDGSFADTGRGYVYDAEDIKASKIKGIRYDASAGKYVLDMALTVSGTDVEYDIETKTTSVSQSQSQPLEADKTYMIGVKAYNYMTDEDGNKVDNLKVYSAETRSNESELPKYEPLEISAELKTEDSNSNSVNQTVTENEDGVLSCTTGSGFDNKWYLYISSNEQNAEYTVTREDTDALVGFDTDKNCHFIDNTDIDGSVMVRIDAKADKGTYTDITTKYMLIEKDNTPPALSMDSAVVYADKTTGAYEITGLTEPNADIYLSDYPDYENPDGLKKVATAGADGRFSYRENLILTTDHEKLDENGDPVLDEEGYPVREIVPNLSGEIAIFKAKDSAGNQSAAEIVSVLVKDDAQTLKSIAVTTMPNKTKYNAGEEFDPEGMVVTAAFNDGSTMTVDDYIIEPTGALANGTRSVTVSYTFGNDTKTTTVPITVGTGSSPSGGGGGGSSSFTVKFETNGGTAVRSESVKRNDTVSEPQTPVREGYDFAGWYTDKELKTKYDFSSKVTKSITLYAAWTPKDNSANQIVLTIGKKEATVFGKTVENDVAPKIVNDRTMLPVRFVAESLGASVSWDGDNQLVTIKGKNEKGEDVTILITIGSNTAVINGENVELDSPAFLENDRTYTPVRLVAERLGADVEWIGDEQKVIITKK